MTQPAPVLLEPVWSVGPALPAVAVDALARLLSLGIPPEALEALAAALERQAVEGRAGRASLHVDSPPGAGPAGGLVESVDARPVPFLCVGRVEWAQERRGR
jgi:hypothetical protein